MFSKILIANRGEIAVRIAKTARALGYETVAIFSDADRGSAHVEVADEAVHIGPSPAAQSYLDAQRILAAARQTGADAIHPGYGFPSENAEFAAACVAASLTFIGPTADAIAAMGDKAEAKRRMDRAGVPTVPGYLGDDQSDERLRAEAERVGFPVLVKANSGGGGRGMRLVRSASELDEAIAGARREAKSAFGDDSLMLERFVEGGRHVEVEIFADTLGNVVHLGERDCTSQRRRQKIIEESPSPIIDAEQRRRMGQDAVLAAREIGYVGAGTVEMIVDQGNEHYFLEMNTRLQVEHPVTELVTGLDLVEWQLRVAQGEALPLAQDDVQLRGHAVEARLYAEDPYAGFAPQTGRIRYFRPERLVAGAGLRVDSGVRQGDDVSPYYDPMIAKVMAYGSSRADALRRLRRALRELPLIGVTTNRQFLIDLLGTPTLVDATITTSTIDEWLAQVQDDSVSPGQASEADLLRRSAPTQRDWAVACAGLARAERRGVRTSSPAELQLDVECGGERRRASVVSSPDGRLVVNAGESTAFDRFEVADDACVYECDGVRSRRFMLRDADRLWLETSRGTFEFAEPSAYPSAQREADPRLIVSPVAGTLVRLEVAVGDVVEPGQTVAFVEAMKMETRLEAGAAGTVCELHAETGAQVAAGAPVVELTLETSDG